MTKNKSLFTIVLPTESFKPRSGVRPSKTIRSKRDREKSRKIKHKKAPEDV